ncbi:complement factor H-like [Clarias gariepinus]|uniref:complement factor H-like n=1 Tax=Clarias gariepinus TaxID=13013 RepID=UPI00234E0531|nr:complement factor H-like [Clarias gariepinus]
MINKELLLIHCQKGYHSNPYAANLLGMGSNMDVTTKIFFVAFWLSFFTVAKSQECLKKDIDFENTLRSGLEDSYPHKATVRLSCATGFVGSLKIECNNGRWEKTGGRDCKKRPCGHPGDTPNGDFRLTKELEFVFGATVEYTCRTGYVMASRVNYRNCRSQGWDNAVPVCEVVRCPVISSLGDVIATGNTEEASYGDVIHFECESPNKMVDGPQDINCKDNGQWSATIPKCKEIECRAPKIHNGSTDYNRVYRDNEIMKYTCDSKYKQRAGNPRCTKYGWSIPPECEEITCLLGARTSGIASTSPPGKNIFKVGEDVEITCEKTYLIVWTKQVSKNITCQADGTWKSSPVCEEMTCEYPRGQHLSYPYEPYYTKRYKFMEKIRNYRCEDGYKSTAAIATCTENGWEPKPQCTVQEKVCKKPVERNGLISNKVTKGFSYTCGSGYKPYDEKWWEVLPCSEEQQSNPPLCIPNDQCGQIPDIHAKRFQEKKGYENKAILKLECESEPCCFECINGQWKNCESKGCGTPPPVENAVIVHIQQQANYMCRENFQMNGNPIITCTNSQEAPACIQQELNENHECPQPDKEINNAVLIKRNLKVTYQKGDILHYRCKPGFDFQTVPSATCSEGQWNYPQCIQTDEKLECPKPNKKINNAVLNKTDEKETYQEGETVQYKCKPGFDFQNESHANCSKGQWIYPECIQSDEKLKCPKPNKRINNAVLNKTDEKETYQEGETVQYKCKPGFDFQNESHANCSNGQWIYPKCIQREY